MIQFIDGPANGVTLNLRRVPVLLRVVCADGQWDALDQLHDTPKPTETVYVYRLVEKPSVVHVDSRGKDGRRRGQWLHYARYEYASLQPMREVLRNNVAWRAWCSAAGTAVLPAWAKDAPMPTVTSALRDMARDAAGGGR